MAVGLGQHHHRVHLGQAHQGQVAVQPAQVEVVPAGHHQQRMVHMADQALAVPAGIAPHQAVVGRQLGRDPVAAAAVRAGQHPVTDGQALALHLQARLQGGPQPGLVELVAVVQGAAVALHLDDAHQALVVLVDRPRAWEIREV
jgi:hypothetical protein